MSDEQATALLAEVGAMPQIEPGACQKIVQQCLQSHVLRQRREDLVLSFWARRPSSWLLAWKPERLPDLCKIL